ncbi:MAG TPA: AAA family ATPase, partial [Solirubrobacteraceae bacterium]
MEEAARASGRSPVALLEREEERERLRNAVTAAAGGRGSLVAIEGPPGIGKTCLLELASELAGDEFERLSARATELEREFPWGVSAQLFERRIVTADSEEREHLLAGAASLAESAIDPTSGGGSFQAEAHGLYWLAANLSAERPLLLLVDDLQWADSASARWLRYLTPRLDGLRALVLVSVRPGAGGEAALVLAEAADVLRPAPLGLEAAGVLLADRLGRPPDPTFASACHEATGGNPFLLEELVATVAADGIEPTAAHAAGVRRLGPPAIARAVLARLGQLPPAASALARSLTILGPAGVALAAALAGLDPDDAFQAANLLVAERILRSDDELDFAHPILSSAVAEDVSPGERAAAHARAARLLAERGEDSERVALHLAATEPAGDAWTVELLCEAAAGALRRGAPDVALSHLRRALAEPPPPEQRPAVLAGLGQAAALAGAPDAVELLTRAHDAAETGPERAALAIELARASALLDGDLDRAAAVLAHEQARADDPDLAIRLAAEWTTLTRYDPRDARQAIDRVERLGREAKSGGPLSRIVFAQMAIESAFAGDSADRSAELAGRALADGTLVAEQSADSPSCYLAIHALVASGRIADAEWHLQVALSDARRRGSALGYASASMCRSHALYARGRVSDAVA